MYLHPNRSSNPSNPNIKPKLYNDCRSETTPSLNPNQNPNYTIAAVMRDRMSDCTSKEVGNPVKEPTKIRRGEEVWSWTSAYVWH